MDRPSPGERSGDEVQQQSCDEREDDQDRDAQRARRGPDRAHQRRRRHISRDQQRDQDERRDHAVRVARWRVVGGLKRQGHLLLHGGILEVDRQRVPRVGTCGAVEDQGVRAAAGHQSAVDLVLIERRVKSGLVRVLDRLQGHHLLNLRGERGGAHLAERQVGGDGVPLGRGVVGRKQALHDGHDQQRAHHRTNSRPARARRRGARRRGALGGFRRPEPVVEETEHKAGEDVNPECDVRVRRAVAVEVKRVADQDHRVLRRQIRSDGVPEGRQQGDPAAAGRRPAENDEQDDDDHRSQHSHRPLYHGRGQGDSGLDERKDGPQNPELAIGVGANQRPGDQVGQQRPGEGIENDCRPPPGRRCGSGRLHQQDRRQIAADQERQ